MPGYTNMPSAWSTALAKKIVDEITTDVIFDVDGENPIHLNGRIFVNSIGTISVKNELDVNWLMRPTLSDFKIDIIDQDEIFNVKNSNSPFFFGFGTLSEAAIAGQNYIKLVAETMSNFSAGNIITISDGTNSQTLVVKLAVTSGSDRILYFYDSIQYSFAVSSTFVFSSYFEEKKIAIDLLLAGTLQPFRIFTGSVLTLPQFHNKRASIVVTDLRKTLMDSPVIGADSASDTKLMIIDKDGNYVNSINWVVGSGYLDRSKIEVYSACRLGKWTIEFETATTYRITGPGKTDEKSILISDISSISNASKKTGFSNLQGVFIKEGKAYICDEGSDTFYVYDISNIDSISLLDSITDTSDLNGCCDCVVVGNYAYVVTANAGTLVTINVSDPTNISIVNVQTPASSFRRITASNGALYAVSYTDDALIIFDIETNPAIPINKKEISGAGSPYYLDGAIDVKVCGSKLYISAYDDSTITVWHLADKFGPELLAAENIYGNTAGIDVVNDIVYVAIEGQHKLALYDFSNHYDITLLDSISGSGSPNYLGNIKNVKVLGNFAFCIGNSDNSLVIIDCTDKNDIKLDTAVIGSGSPYYLKAPVNLDIKGNSVIVLSQDDGAISCFKLGFDSSSDYQNEQIKIPISAWSGQINAGDKVEFWTGISFNNINVIQALYNIYTKKLSNEFLDCSSYFGNKVIGTLYEEHTAGSTTLIIRNSVPIIIPDGDTLTLTEGTATEDVTVATSGGNSESTSFPPYITLKVSALTNSYTSAAIVTWKKRNSLDTNYSFDREYSYCNSIGANLKFTVAKEMSYQQLILLILAHSNSFNFQSNYGVEKVTTLRAESVNNVPILSYSTNLKNLEVETLELANKFIADYQFNYIKDTYDGRAIYPQKDSENESYLKHGVIKQAETVKLPGFLTETSVNSNLKQKYDFYQNGVIIYYADVTLQGLNIPIGSIVKIESLYPNITAYAKVMGYDISVSPYNIRLMLLDISHLL